MKFLSPPLFVLVFGILTLTGCEPPSSKFTGAKAPDVFLNPLSQGRPNPLADLYNEAPVLLVFWASWCPSCVQEIPLLNKWHRKFAPQGLKILGINVQESREEVRKFKEAKAIDYPIALDEKGEIAEAFGVAGIPSAVFLAKGGKILYYGFSLPQNIDRLLKKGETKI